MRYEKIYLKITTIPNQLEVDIDSTEIAIFRNKYESHKSFLKDSDVELAYLNESAVNGSFARIYSITLGFVHEGTPIVKTMYGDEVDLLDKLLSILRKEEFLDTTVIMYNRVFILSFLSKRLRKHNYKISMLPISLQSFDKKAWTIKGSKCIQDYVKGISYQTENFSETCFIHGVEADIIEGSVVARHIKKKQYDIVHKSDLNYVYALMQVDSQLSEETLSEGLNGHIEKVGQAVKQDINVLEHIIGSGQLSTKIVEAIVEFTEQNGLNKEDVLTLVKTALSKTKEYQKVNEEDFIELKDALGLTIDYSKIQCVADKGNLGKKEADNLTKLYKKSSEEERKEIVSLTEKFLIENGKIGQKRAKEAFELLTKKLLN